MPAALNDALLRHQVYLEGVKLAAYDETEIEERARAVEAEIIGLIAGLGVASMSELTVKRLNNFVRRIRKSVGIEFRKLARAVQSFTRNFYEVENTIHRELLRNTRENPVNFQGVLRDIRKRIENRVVPGVGVETKRLFPNMLRSLENELSRLIRSGYANALSVEEMISELLGAGREKLRGWSGKIRRNGRNGLNTMLQHISTNMGAFNQAQVFNRYQWVSVIDDVTTDICTRRDGRVYVYGKGPLPPAHYNCRSTVVPYEEGADGLATWRGSKWFDWARDQPEPVLRDMIGRNEARNILQDGANASNFSKLTTVRKLPLSGFLDKIRNMLL